MLLPGRKCILLLSPLFGIILFIIFYVIAANLYPGGSQVNVTSKGFSWINNYWCNLLNEKAINGQLNPARPVALLAMAELCFSLAVFWYIFPQQVVFEKRARLLIQFSGMLSMLVALFLFTAFHDAIINLAVLLAATALIGTLAGLHKNRWHYLFYLGIFNLVLVAVNNYVYYTKGLIIYLPVIQKITFALFLFWIGWIDIMLYRKAIKVQQ